MAPFLSMQMQYVYRNVHLFLPPSTIERLTRIPLLVKRFFGIDGSSTGGVRGVGSKEGRWRWEGAQKSCGCKDLITASQPYHQKETRHPLPLNCDSALKKGPLYCICVTKWAWNAMNWSKVCLVICKQTDLFYLSSFGHFKLLKTQTPSIKVSI